MATLQTIRNRAGVLISVVIGLSLLAFVLGDFLGSGNMFSGPDVEIAVIDGKSVQYQEYEQVFEELIENYKRNTGSETQPDEATVEMIREQAWDILLKRYTLETEIEKVGINVTDDELFDMVQGTNIDPQLLQIPVFQNQQTGMFDRALVVQFLKNMDQQDPTGNARASWVAFEKQLVQNKRVTKYNNLIKKAIYIPAALAEMYNKENTDKVDCKFVFKAFATIADSTLAYTDEELQKYYTENSYKYEQEATRDIDYVVFDVFPSNEDMQKLDADMQALKLEFATVEDVPAFINYNSDRSFEDKYFKKGTLNPAIDSLLFAAESGFIYGPYNENQNLVLAKLMEKKNLSDSVHARHILIQPSETRSVEVVKSLADSLKKLLDNKADFKELAMRFSDDKGSVAEGGDLKWFARGAMVKPFEDTCFSAKVNEYKLVETQFGVHIIQVLEKSVETPHIKVGFVERIIEPSQQTRQQVFAAATEFISKAKNYEEFNKYVTEKGLVKRTANNLTSTESKISGLESPREIIRWAYNDAEKNQVSEIFELADKFVVVALIEVREKGVASLEQVKEDVILNVRKNKKAEKFIADFSKYAGAKVDDLATKIGEMPVEGPGITFNSFSLPNVGIEPEVIAAMSVAKKGFISKPMKGNNGVFVYEIINVVPSAQKDFLQDKIRVANDIKTRVDYQTFEALKKCADIEDKRVKFM